MDYHAKLNKHLQTIVGKQLDALNMACEMMMFSFGEYELHAQCLTRIIYENDVLVFHALRCKQRCIARTGKRD